MSEPAVAICTVVYNSADDLPEFLSTLADCAYPDFELILVDNASADGSADVARRAIPAGLGARVIDAGGNLGFAGGMNLAIAATEAPLILSLNADARPQPDFVDRLVERVQTDPRIGAVAGRLVRPTEGGERRIDACGMHLVPTWRHFDRGSSELDRGQFDRPEQVFGATGAASLYRRSALDDVALDGEIFLEEFHSFREDAELCFRFAERGWRVVFEPTAAATHRRHSLPSRRREMNPLINYHSLKNRYLLRVYHRSWATLLLTSIPALARDVGIATYVLLFERSSLDAYRWLWQQRRRIAARRRRLRARRTASAQSVAAWFVRRSRPL